MKKGVTVLLVIATTFSASAQNSYCDSLLKIQSKEKYSVLDPTAFCRGVEIALATNGLVIRSIGDPGHLTQCEFHSYSNYGVRLILTGDFIMPGQEDENAGFNSVMIPRIKDSIGEQFNLLGKLDTASHDLGEQEFMLAMSGIFEFKEVSDTTVKITINPEKEKMSTFESLVGIQFSDQTENWVSRDSLLVGAVFRRNQSGSVYLMIDFNHYPNENNICQASGIYIIPIRIE